MAATENQKLDRARRTREFLDLLIQRHPTCFTRKREDIRPLAIGIQKTLRAELADDPELHETPGWVVRQALALYTRSPAYLEATIAGQPRINLDGTEAEPVTDEAKRYAQEQRDAQKARQAARKPKPKPKKPRRPSKEELQQRKLQALAEKFNG